ncbi:serine hydrolase domain-containing protein [Rhodococcus sovatensis]|uniref:Serine hydrolase domain-containing protein n=1 Tax=Rhodococcus sovatensis TaxID=1805840 RepID=A0ABZ2PK58_9NOCA
MPTGARRVLAMLCVLVTVGAIVALGSGTVRALADTQPAVLQEAVDGWASEIGAPGMTVQIVDSDGVVAQASTGVDGRGAPVDDATPFVWGSVSKQLTAATVRGLERDGFVDENARVVDVVPQARQILVDPAVTVGDLIFHTSGLPHDITGTDDWTRRESAADAVATMYEPDGVAARGTFRYSSLNYLLLQAVVEMATDGSFADALEREVLEPAGATTTITDPEDFERSVPPGHVPFFGSARSIDVGVDAAGLGYGYLAGSISDLGRYAAWRLAELQNGESSMAEVDTGHGTTYGNGLFHESIGGQDVWWHSGAVPGYYAYVAFVPGENVAMVLAANRYGEIEAERIAAVGRNVTTLVVDGSTSDLPGSMAPIVLGVLLGALALLIGWIVLSVYRVLTGRTKESSFAGAAIRVLIVVVGAGVTVIGVYVGVPMLVGATPTVMALWAPDVAVMFWVLLGAVCLTATLLVVSQVVGYGKSRRH